MANIPKVNGNFNLEVTSSSQTYTDTLYTDNKNISGDIDIKITAQAGSAAVNANTITASFTQSNNVITLSGSKTITASVTPGWVTSVTSANVNVIGTYTIPAATPGTPIATKGTVSNNQITVTPKVTNTAGYITAGTITGSAVTVSASELVSGKTVITSPANSITVTNYQYVDVSIITYDGSYTIS